MAKLDPEKRVTIHLVVPADLKELCDRYGGHRRTNVDLKRVNVSEVVRDFLYEYFAKLDGDARVRLLAKRKSELVREIESIDRESSKRWGVGVDEALTRVRDDELDETIEKTLADHRAKTGKDDKFVDLVEAWDVHQKSRPTKAGDLEWARHRIRSSKLSLDPEEFVKKMHARANQARETRQKTLAKEDS